MTRGEQRKKLVSRHGLLAALVASVILAATGAMAQEQPAGAVPAVEAPAPAPATPAAAAPATPALALPAGATPAGAMELTLPRDLSPWGMFMAADIIVKAVMIGLAFASLVTWTIWLAKSLEIFGGKLRVRRAVRAIGDAATLKQASRALDRSGGPGALRCGQRKKRPRFRPVRSTMSAETG
ncbi:hypothetical protein FJ970_05560 [Mesorhizobium sp. B2-1-8]|nr:hypothetical protein FJ970_05560 [Mesorhizobium sp. B2-1-8]